MLNNDRLIRALRRQPVDRTPVWIMRQAGRYLPEYRALRKQATDFLTLCKTPELACCATLQPINRFPLDAAIIFSDILTIPDAYGLGLTFLEGEGPCFRHPVRIASDIKALPTVDPETELRYVMDAIRMVSKELAQKIPLIGFSGSPWTIATYMVEGRSSKNFSHIKGMMYRDPILLHQLLNHLTMTIIDYLNAQVAAGANVLMIFDTWGGVLSRKDYLEFSLKYLSDIVKGVRQGSKPSDVPIILFSKNGGQHLIELSQTGCDAVGLDWTADLNHARRQVGQSVALQGNLDPAALYGNAQQIQQAVKAVLQAYGEGPGHIFNLGHGIYPDIDPEHVSMMIEAVQSERVSSPKEINDE